MEFVDRIKRGDEDDGTVTDPDKIISMKVAADAPMRFESHRPRR
jgi:hypothetical protein